MPTEQDRQDDIDLAAGRLTCKCGMEYCEIHHEIGDNATTPQRCSDIAVTLLRRPDGDRLVPLCEECAEPWRLEPLKGKAARGCGPAGQWAADRKTRRLIWKRWAWCGTRNPYSWANVWALIREFRHVRSDINALLEIIGRLQMRIDTRGEAVAPSPRLDWRVLAENGCAHGLCDKRADECDRILRPWNLCSPSQIIVLPCGVKLPIRCQP